MLLCNQTDPNEDKFKVQPCFESQDLNHITLCFRKVVTHQTGVWRAESSSDLILPAFIKQLFVILVINRILTLALRRFHVPRIAAEILVRNTDPISHPLLIHMDKKNLINDTKLQGGLILGPSGFGFTDLVTKHILPWGTLIVMENIAALGMIYFMFIVGLEVDLKPVLGAGKKALTTALAGILVPFPIGYALHYLLIENFSIISKGHVNHSGPLFWGLALATTNFPDLAGLLADLKLLHTDVGRTALTSAVVSDLLCWVIFIFTLATSHKGRIFTVATTSVYILLCAFVFRPALK